jgi:flagellar hook-basal body complex protein FliE
MGVDLQGITSGLGVGGAFPVAREPQTPSMAAGAGKFFSELVSKVNELQAQSDQAIQGLATGENKNLHEAMISMEKASISFLFMSQVRNKALDAYQEVMRMQV